LSDWDKGQSAWKSNKPAMIVKVAQVLALRDAFPISGVQVPEHWSVDDQGTAKPVTVGQDKTEPEEKKRAIKLIEEGRIDEVPERIWDKYPELNEQNRDQ